MFIQQSVQTVHFILQTEVSLNIWYDGGVDDECVLDTIQNQSSKKDLVVKKSLALSSFRYLSNLFLLSPSISQTCSLTLSQTSQWGNDVKALNMSLATCLLVSLALVPDLDKSRTGLNIASGLLRTNVIISP